MTGHETDKTAKRSKIIVEVANGRKKLTDALFELKILLSDLGSLEAIAWIDAELSGYRDDNVPDYREFDGVLFGNTLQAGRLLRRNMAIPVKSEHSDCTHVKLRDNISAIENFENREDKSDLSISVNAILANAVADYNPEAYCEVSNAWIKIPLSKYTDILNAVRSRVLDILLMLEKKYGNLDNYTIDFGEEDERMEVSKIIVNIIHNDNSVGIGSNNKISNSKIGEGDGD